MPSTWCSSPAMPMSIIQASPWPCWAGCWKAKAIASAILSQPDWRSCEPWRIFGRPRLFFAISAGNMDSMINHYTANRKVRNDDAYSPGGQIGRRPDRATLGLLPTGSRGVQGRAGDCRRRRSQPAPHRPLRLLERQSSPGDRDGLQSRSDRVRHGRADDRRNRPAAGGRRIGPQLRDLAAWLSAGRRMPPGDRCHCWRAEAKPAARTAGQQMARRCTRTLRPATNPSRPIRWRSAR